MTKPKVLLSTVSFAFDLGVYFDDDGTRRLKYEALSHTSSQYPRPRPRQLKNFTFTSGWQSGRNSQILNVSKIFLIVSTLSSMKRKIEFRACFKVTAGKRAVMKEIIFVLRLSAGRNEVYDSSLRVANVEQLLGVGCVQHVIGRQIVIVYFVSGIRNIFSMYSSW